LILLSANITSLGDSPTGVIDSKTEGAAAASARFKGGAGVCLYENAEAGKTMFKD